MEGKLKKVAIVGPESTGKSVLTQELAAHFDCDYVPEFARTYLESLGRKYTYDDVILIAQEQLKLQNSRERQAKGRFLFCDTTLLTIKIWLKVVFGVVPSFIEEELYQNKYDFYLLTDIDMPWEADPLREHPHFRKELFEMHVDELTKISAKYFIVNGHGIIRTQHAINSINQLIL